MKKRKLYAIIMISLCVVFIGCTVPSKIGEYVSKAYNVSNEMVGVLKQVQDNPEDVTNVIDSLVSAASTLRDALYKAGLLLDQELEEPKSKSAKAELDEATAELQEVLDSEK